MSQEYNYKCISIDHEPEPIFGFCLNIQCKHSPFCLKCLQTHHKDHQQISLEYDQIHEFLQDILDQQNKNLAQLENVGKEIQKLIMRNVKNISCQEKQNIFSQKYMNLIKLQQVVKEKMEELSKFIQSLINDIQQKNYYQFSQSLGIIKLYKNDASQIKQNKILLRINQLVVAIQQQAQQHDDNLRQQQEIQDDELQQGIELINLSPYEEEQQLIKQSINNKEDQRYIYKGFALHEIKQYEEAIKFYDKSIEINPKNEQAYNQKGAALYELKRYEEAIACYNKSIEINSLQVDTHNSKGVALVEMKRFEEAIACYDLAMQINPRNDCAFYYKEDAIYEMKKQEKLILSYDKSIEIDP